MPHHIAIGFPLGAACIRAWNRKALAAIYVLPQASTLRRNTRMVPRTETPAQSGRAFHPT